MEDKNHNVPSPNNSVDMNYSQQAPRSSNSIPIQTATGQTPVDINNSQPMPQTDYSMSPVQTMVHSQRARKLVVQSVAFWMFVLGLFVPFVHIAGFCIYKDSSDATDRKLGRACGVAFCVQLILLVAFLVIFFAFANTAENEYHHRKFSLSTATNSNADFNLPVSHRDFETPFIPASDRLDPSFTEFSLSDHGFNH